VWRADDLADCSILLMFKKMGQGAAAVTVPIAARTLLEPNRQLQGYCKVREHGGNWLPAVSIHGEPAAAFIRARIARARSSMPTGSLL
jgi:hypothetical protein